MSGWECKTRKTMIPSSISVILWIVSVSQEKKPINKGKKRRKKERKKKNIDTQNKLDAPHVRYEVKILLQ